jgi:hypothetical protein
MYFEVKPTTMFKYKGKSLRSGMIIRPAANAGVVSQVNQDEEDIPAEVGSTTSSRVLMMAWPRLAYSGFFGMGLGRIWYLNSCFWGGLAPERQLTNLSWDQSRALQLEQYRVRTE